MRKGDSIPYVTTSLGAFGLFCNLNMLERNRLKVPQTLEEFLAACAAFHRIGIAPCRDPGMFACFAHCQGL